MAYEAAAAKNFTMDTDAILSIERKKETLLCRGEAVTRNKIIASAHVDRGKQSLETCCVVRVVRKKETWCVVRKKETCCVVRKKKVLKMF